MPLVRMCHTVSMEETDHQYGGGCAIRSRVCSTDLSHHQYSEGCAVRTSQIISTDVGVQHRTTKTAQRVVGS